ncbi:hypothetical protein ACFC09_14410 [Streptomyces sp. NPDC056161]|uniref:hypothetical protein n=1 Tax=Streptomyces sp. NPDC056161 TaxID=3345732 RepID=UPI0035D998BD
MDQGLAAILGALAGAVATGLGAYVAAKATSRLSKRQARREAYKNYLLDLAQVRWRLDEVHQLIVGSPIAGTFQFSSGTVDERLSEIESLSTSLERNTVAVGLEGPSTVAEPAHFAMVNVIYLRSTLNQWRAMDQATRISEEEIQYTNELIQDLIRASAMLEKEARKHL